MGLADLGHAVKGISAWVFEIWHQINTNKLYNKLLTITKHSGIWYFQVLSCNLTSFRDSSNMPANGSSYGLFREDFHQYYSTLCQYAFTILKDSDLSEDVVQEVFLRVWEKKQDLVGTKELRFYLFTAVRNNCLTALEKNKKHNITTLSDHEVADEEKELLPPDTTGKTYEQLLAEALNQLPPKCREVFLLSRMSKLTYQQIGDTLGISVKTVENQMGKALKILRIFVKGLPVIIIIAIFFSLFRVLQ